MSENKKDEEKTTFDELATELGLNSTLPESIKKRRETAENTHKQFIEELNSLDSTNKKEFADKITKYIAKQGTEGFLTLLVDVIEFPRMGTSEAFAKVITAIRDVISELNESDYKTAKLALEQKRLELKERELAIRALNNPDMPQIQNQQNNIYIGSPSDLLKLIKSNSELAKTNDFKDVEFKTSVPKEDDD